MSKSDIFFVGYAVIIGLVLWCNYGAGKANDVYDGKARWKK